MKKIIVIGGGPAGIFASITASNKQNNVILLEKNEKLGKKLFITGKGRCNITNNSSIENVINNVVTNPRFLYSALNTFSPQNTIDFFENNGLKLKTERGNRVFPNSDKSSDVIKCFQKVLDKNLVDVRVNTKVENIIVENGKAIGVIANNKKILADSIIIATGGISYPLTGSTGDGYMFSTQNGHALIKPKSALCGIVTRNHGLFNTNNLLLKNVVLSIKSKNKTLYSELGELTLTEYGLTGPLALTCSSYINKKDFSDIDLVIDFKPGLTSDTLEQRILRDIKNFKNITLFDEMKNLVPVSIINAILSKGELNKMKLISELSVCERKTLVNILKSFYIKPVKLRPIDEAIITSGGISVKEIDPKTMESKLIKNLFFAGEVIDVDALTGGYNIQIALSTGYIAGLNA